MNTGDLIDGRFRLRGRLGAGGMSVVWRAHDEVLGRDVAVKVLSPALARDPARLAHIRDEARAVARLRHPNIVEVYDYGEAGSLPYLVMEVAEGRTLAQLLTAGALPWETAVVIVAQVAAALAAAHERDVVHRDVKPDNVVVSGARVKLLDFGISALSGDDDRTTGYLLGTPAYLAPERLEHGVVRPATDVYALGLLLYRALAGRLPWAASTATQMLRAHRYHEPHGLPPVAGLPAEVADLCRRCLAKNPAHRPSAAAAAEALAAAVALDPATLTLPGPVPAAVPVRAPRPAPTVAVPAGSRRRVAAVSAAVLVAAGAVAAVTLTPDAPGPVAQAAATPPAAPKPECTVGFVVATGDGRFTTRVSVANTGDVPIPAAPLSFTLPADQRLAGGTPGVWRQSGRTVTARIADLAPGHDHTATVRGTSRGSGTPPHDFTLDGTACRVTLAVSQSAPAPTAADPAKPAPAGPPAKKPKKPKPKDAKGSPLT
ncbi:serine/threonine-protein kinase [Actinoplanes subglobosus]|uniref:non-specific serine/threonine protein kinase n=1 Tax=Actinoplanes subglobosus TaxID=1547892 RepID=A0ABV8J1L8_9ACTN